MADEDDIEAMIEDLRELLDTAPGRLSHWERAFIESVEDWNDVTHLSDAQREKLEEIHDRYF